ncbi:RRP44A [Symbiodinium sp. CCMP2592]|nr:RRP44A [Symbiodinium sp. CCMP2592]
MAVQPPLAMAIAGPCWPAVGRALSSPSGLRSSGHTPSRGQPKRGEQSGHRPVRLALAAAGAGAARAAAAAVEAPPVERRARRRRTRSRQPPQPEEESTAQQQEEEEEAPAKASEDSESQEIFFKPYPAHLRQGQLTSGLQSGQLLVGELRQMLNSRTLGVVYVPDAGEFLISGQNAMNRAVDGDIVIIEKLRASEAKRGRRPELKAKALKDGNDVVVMMGKPAAKIVAIKKRSQREVGGTIYSIDALEEKRELLRKTKGVEQDDCLFIPADSRFPDMLVKAAPEQYEDQRVTVILNTWQQFCPYPRARFSRKLGKTGDVEVETEMILLEFNVKDEPFTEEVLSCLPPEDFAPSAEDFKGRMDFRDVCVFSIDPPGCEDVDDALSCEELDNGNFRIGVHIADVTRFVKPDTELDREGAERSTSVYLVNKRVDMLPKLLTTEICSLRFDGKDHLTFSAVFELTPDAEMVSAQFNKAVIRSRGALSYKEAQERLDSDPADDQSEVTVAIRNLWALAQKLRSNRIEDGALNLESGELKFELDSENQTAVNVFQYETYDTNRLIEEFMLLANRRVAEEISGCWEKTSVLRRHPPPKEESMDDLVTLLDAYGIKDFKHATNKELQKSLDTVDKPDDPFFNRLVRILSTRCMEPARYFCTGDRELEKGEWAHFGLAMDHYTHFTSPIRRYADVLVHRLLAASQGFEEVPTVLRSPQEIKDACEHMNIKHRNAQYADRSSVKLHQYQLFQDRGPTVAEGVIMRVVPEGISVAIEEYGAEGTAKLSGQNWLIILDKQTAYGRPRTKFEGINMKVFDRVVVSIEADLQDLSHRELRFTQLG